MNRKTVLISIAMSIMSLTAAASVTHKVEGKITDEKGRGLPGANVVVVGTGKGHRPTCRANIPLRVFRPERSNSRSR